MAEKFIADKNIHDGHRSRMRSKFLAYGADIFDTYELLEMFLYGVIPYKDTNPIAKRLLCAFSSLDGVFTASKEELMQVEGIGERAAEYIIRASKMKDILETEPLVDRNPFSHYHKIGSFFRDYFKDVDQYKVSLLLLDNNMLPISLTDLYDKDCCHGSVKAHPFLEEAVNSGASLAVIAHTHPFTTTLASEGDIATNHVICDALSAIGVMVIEHYIISGDKYNGFMDHEFSVFSAGSELEKFMESKKNKLSSISQYEALSKVTISGTTKGSYEVQCVADLLSHMLSEKSIDIAYSLYLKYFSFERALATPAENLSKLLGSKCTLYLKLLAKITARRTTDKIECGRIYTEAELADYFKAKFIGESVEKLYLMTFDSHHRIISCDLITEGTVNFTSVAPRKILEIAFEKNAKYVAISHNHPRGAAKPSDDDTKLTSKLLLLLNHAKITLEEHFIAAGSSCYCIIKDRLY